MKNNEIILFITFLSCLLFGCNISNETPDKIVLPDAIQLKGQTIQIDNNMLNPMGMCISDEKLIIFDDVQSGLFKVFNIPELAYEFSWGSRGKGPEEFLVINNNYIRSFRTELELLDNGILKRLAIMNDRLKIKSIKRLPIMENPINGLQRINDSIYFADNFFSDGSNEHLIINVNTGKILNKFGNYPNGNLKIKDNHERYQIYHKSSISDPASDKFVVFYTYFGKIKIYNNTGELIKSIILDDKEIEMVSLEKREQNKTYFALPYATKNYFSILRINKTDEEIVKDINNYKPELLIWDWNGNLINRYKLDKPLTRYAISEKYQKLYGTFIMKDDEIYIFDLPNQ